MIQVFASTLEGVFFLQYQDDAGNPATVLRVLVGFKFHDREKLSYLVVFVYLSQELGPVQITDQVTVIKFHKNGTKFYCKTQY